MKALLIYPSLLGTTAFLNSILCLGILDKWNNKIYYWKLLLKALVFYHRFLRAAVTLMIFGYHYRKLFGE
jgi:hypothetical protein